MSVPYLYCEPRMNAMMNGIDSAGNTPYDLYCNSIAKIVKLNKQNLHTIKSRKITFLTANGCNKVSKKMLGPLLVKKCQHCERVFSKKENKYLCKGCKAVYYCRRECQKKDWAQVHRLVCSKRNSA